MNKKLIVLSIGILVVAFCSASFTADAQNTKTTDIAVVVQPDTPVDDLTLADVRKVFKGERQYWAKQVPVVVIVRAPEARERQIVLRQIFQMNDAQYKQYWIAKIFRAETTSTPKIVYSNDMAHQLVAAVPGAIAFMDSRDVKPGVKVVKVDGLLPGQPGYPLH